MAQQLGLGEDEWAIAFQSRFGKQEWVKPYTDVLLDEWARARAGVGSVQVVSPAFSADCLETLEELAIQNAELFLHAGGRSYAYIPGLNTREDQVGMMVDSVRPLLEGVWRGQGG